MIQILTGDCLAILPALPERSVQCCVTSPPYWGLRDYGVEGAFGLESTPTEYIERMVAVFRQVWRVLRDDGTLWVNLGDSYNNFRVSMNGQTLHKRELRDKFSLRRKVDAQLKEKDLCGIPWRVALALQTDGWYLRSDIIWSKPNPMPESVTDRCTKAHEYIFLLTKRVRYYYDADAISEEFKAPPKKPGGFAPEKATGPNYRNGHSQWENRRTVEDSYPNDRRNRRTVWKIATQPYADAHFATFPEELPKLCILAGSKVGDMILDPFGGSGTVGKVALELGRKCTLIELNSAYVELARKRTNVTPAML